jgi:hypothetical protein
VSPFVLLEVAAVVGDLVLGLVFFEDFLAAFDAIAASTSLIAGVLISSGVVDVDAESSELLADPARAAGDFLAVAPSAFRAAGRFVGAFLAGDFTSTDSSKYREPL